MQVLEAVRERRSVRKYQDRELAGEDLGRLLEAARLAPSGMNLYPWELVMVTSPAGRKALVGACNGQRFVGECSAVLCGVDDPGAKWHAVDLALAFENLALEAVELGLGSCFIGAFSEAKVKAALGIPAEKKVVMLMTVGFPAERPKMPAKKRLDELVHWEKY